MPWLDVPNAEKSALDRILLLMRPGMKLRSDKFTTSPGQSIDKRLQEERGLIPKTPQAPYPRPQKGNLRGGEASLFPDVPNDPTLMEQAKRILPEMVAQMLLDPNNIGMPGVGMTYREARQAANKMLLEASDAGYKNIEQALLEIDPARAIHPDALEHAVGMRITYGTDAPGMLRYTQPFSTPPPLIPLSDDLANRVPLIARGGRRQPGLNYHLLINPNYLEGTKNAVVNPGYTKGVIRHEVAHANHLFGGEVPMPSYDAVVSERPYLSNILEDYNRPMVTTTNINAPDTPFTRKFIEDYLKYFWTDPQERVAQLDAIMRTAPDVVKNYTSRPGAIPFRIPPPDPTDLKLLDPVYYQSLLDFMKR